jgi:hypothetical protein
VMRAMLMGPQNRFRMRDGLVSILAGNLDVRREYRLPMLAFRIVYYLLSMAARLGMPLRQLKPG